MRQMCVEMRALHHQGHSMRLKYECVYLNQQASSYTIECCCKVGLDLWTTGPVASWYEEVDELPLILLVWCEAAGAR
jgi:hypothetical protein